MLYIKRLFLAFLCMKSIAYGQSIEQIDSFIDKNHQIYIVEGDLQNAIKNAFEITELSKKIDYARGIHVGYYTVATAMSTIDNYEKSIEYIKKAKKNKKYLKESFSSAFNLLMLQAENNNRLGFADLARTYYNQAKEIVLKDTNQARKSYYLMNHYLKAALVYKDVDILLNNYLKGVELSFFLENDNSILPINEIYLKRFELYDLLGNLYKSQSKYDSAKYYYRQGLDLGLFLNNNTAQYLELEGLGTLYMAMGKYDSALMYINQSEDLAKEDAIRRNLLIIYNSKRKLWGEVGNIEKENEYRQLYEHLSDSLNAQKDKGRDKALLSIVDEKEAEIQASVIKKRNIILGFTITLITLLFVIFYFFRKYRLKKYNILNSQHKIIEEEKNKRLELEVYSKEMKQQIDEFAVELQKVEAENHGLISKVNESFDELIKMATENNPHFWKRFQETYPSFLPKMLAIDEQFRKSELILCAYLYLGFSSKDYSTFTFKSYKTVENYRYNIRKRLGLDSEIDLRLWLQNYIDANTIT